MKNRTAIAAIALLLAALCGAGPAPAQPDTPDLLKPCAFELAELREVLGLDIERTHAADMKFPGGRDVGCFYRVRHSETVLSVRQIWDPAKEGLGESGSAPQLHPVAGDPDHAVTGIGPPDHPSAELVYWRGIVKTRLLVHGPTVHPDEMLQKLLKLRRVP